MPQGAAKKQKAGKPGVTKRKAAPHGGTEKARTGRGGTRYSAREVAQYGQSIEARMAAKLVRNEGAKFALKELNVRGSEQVKLEDEERQRKLEKLKRRATSKDGFEASLRKAEKRLREAEEDATLN